MNDAVLVRTGDRELTRFHRGGTPARITLPFTPLALQISTHVFAVDDRGATHRFTLDGAHEGFVPAREELAPRAAALSRDGSKLAVLADRVRFFAYGVEHPWSFEHRHATDWRETGVGLSGDGTCVLVRYELRGGENLGDHVDAFAIVRSDGVVHYRHLEHAMPELAVAMSHDARRIAYHLHDHHVHVAEGVSMAPRHRVEPKGRVHAMRWFDERLAILFDYELVIVDETITRIALPEHFEDVVLVGDEAVCVHRELGAWWIKAAPAA